MTAQYPEVLINNSDVELGWLKPYFVRRADKSDAFPVAPVLAKSSNYCSALWRGYIATMRLHPDDRLELEHFAFPFANNIPPQLCNAFFTGDFSITFRPFFFGPNTVIPFRGGCIVRDSKEWQIDDQTMEGVVSSVARDRHTNKHLGLNVDVSGWAFAPRSLIPDDIRDDLDAIVGHSVCCTVAQIDEERGIIIVRIERVAPVRRRRFF